MLDPATKTSDSYRSYDSYESRDYGSRARKAAQNYTKYKSWNGSEVRFGVEENAAEESGICSPPLWTTSPPRSPPQQRPLINHYRSLSPTSRTQAIARGQRELMEMVRNMPEACYELSLKDLVEKKSAMVEIRQESRVEERDILNTKSNEVLFRREDSQKKKKNDKRGQVIRRSKSIDSGGFYLKMVFPVTFGSKKKKKNDSLTNNTSAKVSPKPPVPDGSAKGVDKEWWKKRFSVSSESESGRSIGNSESMKSSGSSSSSSSSRSSIRRRSGGCCWSFIHTKKNQTRSK